MPTISIPTNIAGFSVPGDKAQGPTRNLFINKYGLNSLIYPRNLGSDPTRKHAIMFQILEPDPNYNPQTKGLGTAGKKVLSETTNIVSEITTTGLPSQKTFETIKEPLGELIGEFTKTDVQRRIRSNVFLYIPDTVNVQYSAQYNDVSVAGALGQPYFLAQAATSLYDAAKKSQGEGFDLEKMVNAAGNDPYLRTLAAQFLGRALGSPEDLAALAAAGVGQALNPQLQVLFQGVGFRSFQFDFLFTPYSKKEAEEVKKIIYEFKYAQAPEIQKGALFETGLFFKVPDKFNIKFFYNGAENKNVHTIGQCVLENVNVDYATNGWSTYEDGVPVQTRLTLQFKETVIVDKNRIKEGF